MKDFSLRLGKNRVTFSRGDQYGRAVVIGEQIYSTRLYGRHFRGGRLIDERDLGSGKVTNSGVGMLVNDPLWIAASTPFSTLSAQNFHTSGTGTTADAQTDIGIQTFGTHFTGGTNNFFTGVVTPPTNAAPNVLKTTGTITYSGSEAVTEWGIAMSNAAFIERTSAGAAPTANTFTDSGATFPTAGNGLKGYVIEIASSQINTPTTTVYAQITSNTATVLTLAAGWLTLANAAASTPGATVAYTVLPTFFDHRNFAAYNVVALDVIQWIYLLTAQAGG